MDNMEDGTIIWARDEETTVLLLLLFIINKYEYNTIIV